jgi:hypothetical protein
MNESSPSEVRVAPTLPDDWPASGDGDAAVVVAQIPSANEVAPGTRVVLLEEAAVGRPGLFGRVMGKRAKRASRAVRGNALLVRGYVRIESARDEASGLDLVWGYAAY